MTVLAQVRVSGATSVGVTSCRTAGTLSCPAGSPARSVTTSSHRQPSPASRRQLTVTLGLIVPLCDQNVAAAGQYITVRGCAPFTSDVFPGALQKGLAGSYWNVSQWESRDKIYIQHSGIQRDVLL